MNEISPLGSMAQHENIKLQSGSGYLSVALGSAVFAGSAMFQRAQQVRTARLWNVTRFVLVIENSKKEKLTFNPKYLGNQRYQPKVGDKVTVHWEVGRRGAWWAYKVEKVDNADRDSKKE